MWLGSGQAAPDEVCEMKRSFDATPNVGFIDVFFVHVTMDQSVPDAAQRVDVPNMLFKLLELCFLERQRKDNVEKSIEG